MHQADLIVTLSLALATALVFGLATQRAGLSPIVGYLLAGMIIGPHTPGFVADTHAAAQLAEVGVVLLMFGVGLHFHLKDLLAVRTVAIPGAVVQTAVTTALGTMLALAHGWNMGAGLVLGLGVSVASTVVLMRVLIDHDKLDTASGHVAVGWLIVEDVFTVLVLVMLPVLADASIGGDAWLWDIAWALAAAVVKVGLLGVLVLKAGARTIPRLLEHVSRTRSRELFTLAVLALALAVATASAAIFDVSMALGAFLAGLVVGQSRVSHQAAADALPMRDAFAVLFFVSVGMLFDPAFTLREPGMVLGVLAIILVAKPAVALAFVLAMGRSFTSALTVAVGRAQIGEFSFILAEAARRLQILPDEGANLLVTGALVSITLNPLAFDTIDPIERWLRRRPRLWGALNRRAESRGDAVNERTTRKLSAGPDAIGAVVVGYGPVGRTVTRILNEFSLQPVVVELNLDTVLDLEARGVPAVFGDAARAEILRSAGLSSARYLVVTLPDLTSRLPVILTARELAPGIKILVRAHYVAERAMLEEVGATAVCYEEAEAAVALAELLLQEIGVREELVVAEAAKIRTELAPRPEADLMRARVDSEDPPSATTPES